MDNDLSKLFVHVLFYEERAAQRVNFGVEVLSKSEELFSTHDLLVRLPNSKLIIWKKEEQILNK